MQEGTNFYSIEFFRDGEIDIKHAFMSPTQAIDLCKLLSKNGVKHTIYCLSRSYSNVNLDNVGIFFLGTRS